MKLYRGILFLCLLFSPNIHAQQLFKGILINALDTSTVSGAVVKLRQTKEVTTTDEKGEFHFLLRSSTSSLSLDISGIGFNEVVNLHKPFKTPQRIYITIVPNLLDNFTFVGLSAKDVVKKAIASIPVNYADSSYFAYSSYRQYEKVNGSFLDLTEAKPVVMFSLKKMHGELQSTEAFAVSQLRNIHHPIGADLATIEDNPADLLVTNAVYHLTGSSFSEGMVNSCNFSFDTTEKLDDLYVIKYTCEARSSDEHGVFVRRKHGVLQSATSAYLGECWEKGKLIIDRKSFAIKHIQRTSARYKNYDYPKNDNFIARMDPKYFIKFIYGDLSIDYEQQNRKWYPKKICRQYTHEFHSTLSSKREYTITSFFEWQADSISRYTSEEYVNKFYSRMQLTGLNYDANFWQSNAFPFQLCNTKDVYNDLKQRGTLDDQFQRSVEEEKKK